MSGSTFPAFASVRRLPNFSTSRPCCASAACCSPLPRGARQTVIPLDQVADINLDPSFLPGYALRTTLRMAAALVGSLPFTFTYAVWAAKSRRAGLVLVPFSTSCNPCRSSAS